MLRRLWKELRADFDREIVVTLQIAVMFADGLPGAQVMQALGLSRTELDDHVAMLARVLPNIE